MPRKTYVDDLTGQRDAARSESITGRKKLLLTSKPRKPWPTRPWKKRGIESADELDSMPDAKGQATRGSCKIHAQTRRTRARDEARRWSMKSPASFGNRSAIAEALGGHEFIVSRHCGDVREMGWLAGKATIWLFKTDDGKLVPVKGRSGWIAKTRN